MNCSKPALPCAILPRFDLRGRLKHGQDVVIDVNCVFEGDVVLGDDVEMGPDCVIRNAKIGEGSKIEAFSHLEDCEIGARAHIGPYARLRPNAKFGRVKCISAILWR